jgi:hypothetical protein
MENQENQNILFLAVSTTLSKASFWISFCKEKNKPPTEACCAILRGAFVRLSTQCPVAVSSSQTGCRSIQFSGQTIRIHNQKIGLAFVVPFFFSFRFARREMQDDNTNRRSLLDVVLEDYGHGKDMRTSRVFLVAEIESSPTAVAHIEAFHENFVSSNEKENNPITGVMWIINQTTCIDVVEASTKTLLTFLRELNEAAKETQIARNLRVCYFSEEVIREFPLWSARSFRAAPESEIQSTNVLKSTFDTYKSIIELAREVKSMPSVGKAKEFMSSSKPLLVQRIPSSERVQSYARNPELCSVGEYLEIFDSPVECMLDSERVWPVEETLKV